MLQFVEYYFTSCQNTVYYKDMLANKVYKLRLFHYILLLFVGLLICHSIHITVKEGYNHSNPEG